MQKNPFLRVMLLASMFCLATTVPGTAQSASEPNRHQWPAIGASFLLPSGWTAEERSQQIWAPDRAALCGVQTGPVEFATASELADWMTAYTAERLAAKRLEQVVIDKRDVTAPSGLPGVAVLVDIRVGGRSQRVFYLHDGIAHVIDCECGAQNWESHADGFQTIQESYDID